MWLELRQLAQVRYPDLSEQEAYVELCRDAFIRFPKEMARLVEPVLGPLANEAPELLKVYGILRGNQKVLSGAELISIIKRVVASVKSTPPEASQAIVDNLTSEVADLSNQMNEKILKSLASEAVRLSNSARSDHVAREIHGIHVIGNSLIDRLKYYERWMQMVSSIQIAQGYQAIKALNVICDHLDNSNNITVSGASGPDGFARPVYDFIQMKIDEIAPEHRNNHRFFVYHRDTNWYGAFHRLIRENSLPPEFCFKAHDLDRICLFMRAVRQELLEEDSEHGKHVIFHLLIPSWYKISIKEPLHFPDDLYPLHIEGQKHMGKALVELNLPAAPGGLLIDVANVLDPKNLNKIAEGVTIGTTLPAMGWGLNGACLAAGLGLGALTGLGLFVAIPVWLGTAVPAMSVSGRVMAETVYNALCEEAPRVLGSNERLDFRSMYFV